MDMKIGKRKLSRLALGLLALVLVLAALPSVAGCSSQGGTVDSASVSGVSATATNATATSATATSATAAQLDVKKAIGDIEYAVPSDWSVTSDEANKTINILKDSDGAILAIAYGETADLKESSSSHPSLEPKKTDITALAKLLIGNYGAIKSNNTSSDFLPEYDGRFAITGQYDITLGKDLFTLAKGTKTKFLLFSLLNPSSNKITEVIIVVPEDAWDVYKETALAIIDSIHENAESKKAYDKFVADGGIAARLAQLEAEAAAAAAAAKEQAAAAADAAQKGLEDAAAIIDSAANMADTAKDMLGMLR